MNKIINKDDIKSILKFFNVIILLLFSLALISNLAEEGEITIRMSGIGLIIFFLASPIIAFCSLTHTKDQHHFYEWDVMERKRKSDFLTALSIDIYFFSFTSVFITVLTFSDAKFNNINSGFEAHNFLGLFYGILLLLNAIFPVYLHGYRSYLEETHNLSDKPQTWVSGNESEQRYRNPPKIYGL